MTTRHRQLLTAVVLLRARQINGEEVASKEQAERLLSSRADVVLLLCRPAEQVRSGTDRDSGCYRALVHNQRHAENEGR